MHTNPILASNWTFLNTKIQFLFFFFKYALNTLSQFNSICMSFSKAITIKRTKKSRLLIPPSNSVHQFDFTMSNYNTNVYLLYLCIYLCRLGIPVKMPRRLFRIHDTTWGGNFCCFSDAFNFAIRRRRRRRAQLFPNDSAQTEKLKLCSAIWAIGPLGKITWHSLFDGFRIAAPSPAAHIIYHNRDMRLVLPSGRLIRYYYKR